MFEICSGIYLAFAIITILLFRVTLHEALSHKAAKQRMNTIRKSLSDHIHD